MRDIKIWALAVIGALTMFLIGCSDGTPTSPQQPSQQTIIITQNQGSQNTGGTGSGTNGASCAPVARVGFQAPSQLVIGAPPERLDATPKDASNNTRSDACNLASGILWTTGPQCSVSDSRSFTPLLRGVTVGECLIAVQVEGVSASQVVQVVQ